MQQDLVCKTSRNGLLDENEALGYLITIVNWYINQILLL